MEFRRPTETGKPPQEILGVILDLWDSEITNLGSFMTLSM